MRFDAKTLIFSKEMNIEAHDEAPKGQLTLGRESGIAYYERRNQSMAANPNLYVIHPDDLESVRLLYPKMILLEL